MIYFTYLEPLIFTKGYVQTNSSGHIFLDIITPLIFSKILNGKLIYNDSWKISKIISVDSWKKNCDIPLKTYDYVLKLDKLKQWTSLSFQQFGDIVEKIKKLEEKYDNILVIFCNVCKIHMHTLCEWYQKKLLDSDVYNDKLIPALKKFYYFNNKKDPINEFAIHIRRGDLADDLIKFGFTYKYYKKIIKDIRVVTNIKIVIYCENDNCEDIMDLNNEKNVNINIGGLNELEKQINLMARSKYLLLSPSSLAIAIGYFSIGKVFCDYLSVKYRSNIFNGIDKCKTFNVFNKSILEILNHNFLKAI